MLNDQIKITGQVRIVVTGADGQIKDQREIKNLVVTTGKQFIAARMVGTPTEMSHMALGASNTAAAIGDTALGSELGRVALASDTASGAVVTYTASFPAGTATGAVVEAGVFNASSSGTMLCRTVFAVVNKGVDDAMSVTWAITVS
jgi:ethanolamine utilization microcompartment shell protein EutS